MYRRDLSALPRALLAAWLFVFVMAGLPAAAAQPAGAPDAPADGSQANGVAVSAGADKSSPPAATAAKPFQEVIKEATVLPGLFTLYQKEDKVWLELKPEDFGQPLFFAIGLTHGVGERGSYGGQMGRSFIVEFKKIGNVVQLIAKNTNFTADGNIPIAQAVKQSFSDSLLAFSVVASKPHPERKSVLIEANALLLADIPMAAHRLEQTYRQAYGFDAKNSSFSKVRNAAEQTSFNVSAHYGLARLSLPPLIAPGATLAPVIPLPATLEDVRSLFLGFHYSFTKLPELMAPRGADDRIGHFVTTRWDYTTDFYPTPKVHYVNRWRLERQDAQAALSEPKQPIVFWLDRNIPDKYRSAIAAGILEWNKAFERIGFKDALRVEQQPKDTDFDTSDTRHASVRWFMGSDAGFAIGPSQVDPRSGEILDADIAISDALTRNPRRFVVQEAPPTALPDGWGGQDCGYALGALDQMNFALDLLEARGEIEPDSPAADAFVQALLKDVVMHEVGHALGLRHNFRSSTAYRLPQLADPAFTTSNGLSGSVMDYRPVNLAASGERQGEYAMSTLGPYDYWAIEYAYKPIAPEQERDELARIAARNTEPQLAYATDEEAGYGGALEGMDPEVNRWDLGDDPLIYYQKRWQLSRELWNRLQDKQFKPGDNYAMLRANLERGFRQVNIAALLTAKYVGGVVHLRDHAGSGRAPLNPVPAQRQRQALEALTKGIFSVDSFRFKPGFMSRLTVDQFERGPYGNPVGVNPDYSLSNQLLGIQRGVLDQLMSDGVATRILDADAKLSDPAQVLRLSELYDTLQAAIWSELKSGGDISALRRNLQREHLRRIATALTKPAATTPADARSLLRENARALQRDLRAALTKKGLSKETRAHLSEAENTLAEALKATFQRIGA